MAEGLNQYELFSGLVGGLALFLFGMDILTRALTQVAGDYMKSILARVTRNRILGLFTGATVTAIIQSSSITTVLLVGFISAGLMSTSQSVAVIFGANIGTTITAQILAFKVTKIALPVLALGFFVSFAAKRAASKQYGLIILGLGLVFFGMSTMSDAMKPLRSYEPFLDFMISLQGPLLAALVGAAFTALVQSSSATTGILIVMASQGLLSLESAIALALGANIGTCITAMLASIGKPREAVRAALVHTLFNVIGAVIWIGFVRQLADLAHLISPAHPELTGAARAAAEVPRQLANIHTLFNLANAVLFIGFTTQFARLVEWLVPDRPLAVDKAAEARFLDDNLLTTPAIALDAARREIARLGTLVCNMLVASMPAAVTGSRLQLSELHEMDRPIDQLHHDIVGYLREVSLGSLSNEQSDRLVGLIKIANDLEHIGDRIARDLVASARKRIDEEVIVSLPTIEVIARLHAKVVDALVGALQALEAEDRAGANEVRAMKQDVALMLDDIARHEMTRLKADEPRRLKTYAREIELIESLDDIFKTTRRIARTQLQLFEPAITGDSNALDPGSH